MWFTSASRLLAVIALASVLWACGGDDDNASSTGATSEASQVPGDEDDQEVESETTLTFGPPNFLEPACDEEGNCVLPLSRTNTTFSGSMTGSSVSSGAGIPNETGGYHAVGVHLFVGTIENCGEGTVVIQEALYSPDGVDASGTFTIAEGSGTGDLVEVSGRGTFTAEVEPDSAGDAVAEGRLSCG